MKKLLLSLLCAAPLIANAQFSQNFDASANLPSGWKIINGGDYGTFTIGPAAEYSAYSLPNSAYIIYDDEDAHDDYLITQQFTVIPGVADRFTYFVRNQDPKYVESYEVLLSTGSNASPADFTTVLKPEGPAPDLWSQVSIDLSAYAGQKVYVAFHSTTFNMFRLHLDNIALDKAPTVAPECPTLVAPANGSTVSTFDSAMLSWALPATGGVPDYYEVYLDETPKPVTRINNGDKFAAVTGLKPSTTYYWMVIAKNAAGESLGCAVNSFTTASNPYAPYCGPLTYTTAVEPITSVSFGGMTNTSPANSTDPHEVFTDKVATVEQGSTAEIKVGGNTAGGYTDRFIVFIDWNQNGVFETSETYFANSASALQLTNSTGVDGKTATGKIAVPADAKLGNTRMRIKKNFGVAQFYANPCFSNGTTTSGNPAGYGQAEDYTVNVTAATLASLEGQAKQTAIYPNPVKDMLNISTSEKITGVTIYSMDGKAVKEFTGKNAGNALPVSSLQKGLYLVKVKTSTSENTYKVIKD